MASTRTERSDKSGAALGLMRDQAVCPNPLAFVVVLGELQDAGTRKLVPPAIAARTSVEEVCCAAIFHNEETEWPNTCSANSRYLVPPLSGDARESRKPEALMIDLGLAQEHQMGTEQSFRTGAAGDTGGNRRLVASNTGKGASVYAADGNRLGRIERVMADEATGEIAYAIVNFGLGSSIGFETDHHPVPWSLLAYNPRFDGYELRIADSK